MKSEALGIGGATIQSSSTRRTWIEMQLGTDEALDVAVVLHTEDVD